jgi:hypothetical protein
LIRPLHHFNATIRHVQARFKTEVSYAAPYGSNGYRSDCNDIEFQQVLVVNHNTARRAWFKQKTATPLTLKLSATNYSIPGSTFGLWTGFSVAANTSYDYQFLICDLTSTYSPGLFFSGLSSSNAACIYKLCDQWCGDASTMYFRTDSGMPGFTGTAFAQNGHTALPAQLLSFGIRGSTPATPTGPSIRFIKITAPVRADAYMQISQLAAFDISGQNVAAGKTCTVSSTFNAANGCAKALDGTLAQRDENSIFISGNAGGGDWFLVTLERNYQLKRVVYYNRVCERKWIAFTT